MKTICYHPDDADGILSAAIVNYYVKGEKTFISSSPAADTAASPAPWQNPCSKRKI